MDFIQQYIIPTSSIQYYAWQNIRTLFASELVYAIVSGIKAISLLVSLALFAGIMYLVIKTNVIGTKVAGVQSIVTPEPAKKNKKISDTLRQARSRLSRVNAEEDRSAVIDAIHALDDGLKILGYAGSSMRETLEKVHAWKTTNESDVLRAYELRVRIVHYPHASVSHDEAMLAVEICEKALKDLGFL